MNFALSTIIVVFLLLPGAIAIKAYYSSLRAKISNTHVPLNELLLQGILASFIIHSTAICFIKLINKEVQFNFLYNLILGKDEKEFVFTNKEFTHSFLQFSFYIIICTITSYLIVKVFKYIVHALKLDMRFNFLRNANHWFLIFNKGFIVHSNIHGKQKEEIDFIMVDVFIKPDIIYSGVLIDFNYSPIKDELENLVLFLAKRRKIINTDNNSANTPNVTSPVEIPGDIFVLPMKDVVNINVHYLKIEEENLEQEQKQPE